VYTVLGRRRARIVSEEMREGADVFAVHAFLPAEASFGLMTEMRQRSSGGAAASLLLSHWERLQVGLPSRPALRGRFIRVTPDPQATPPLCSL
jgi:translation elongation factor EF-G